MVKLGSTAIFFDGDNLRITIRDQGWLSRLTPEHIEKVIEDKWGNPVSEATIFINMDNSEGVKQGQLYGDAGWKVVHTPKLTAEGKCATDGYIFLAVMKAVNDTTISNIVIGSGDHDFLPIMKYVRGRKNLLIVTPTNGSNTIRKVGETISMHDLYLNKVGNEASGMGPFATIFKNVFGDKA